MKKSKMNPEEFEKHLKDQPIRSIPKEWKSEILPQSVAAVYDRRTENINGGHRPPLQWLQDLLWPAPRAWATLAAVWVVLIALQYSPSEEAKKENIPMIATTPTKTEILEQKELLVELGLIPVSDQPSQQHPSTNPVLFKEHTEIRKKASGNLAGIII